MLIRKIEEFSKLSRKMVKCLLEDTLRDWKALAIVWLAWIGADAE